MTTETTPLPLLAQAMEIHWLKGADALQEWYDGLSSDEKTLLVAQADQWSAFILQAVHAMGDSTKSFIDALTNIANALAEAVESVRLQYEAQGR